MKRVGQVKLSGRLVGTIEEDGGQTVFTYSPEWLSQPEAVPVSLALPLRAEPYVSQGLHPFSAPRMARASGALGRTGPNGWFGTRLIRGPPGSGVPDGADR